MTFKTGMLAACPLALAFAACTKKDEAAQTVGEGAPRQDGAASQPSASTPAIDAAAMPAPADSGNAPVDGEASISPPPTSVAGANINVTWTGPANGADYIDIVPRGFIETRNEITYVYVRGTNGAAKLRVPTTPGDYDVRYILDLSGARSAKAVAPLTVTVAQATLDSPATAESGQALNVL